MKRLVMAVSVGLLLVVAGAAYFRVGWWRMETACNADPPGGPQWNSVELGWSWNPVGFQCTYDDGTQRTSLWF